MKHQGEALRNLREFLKGVSAQALESLEESLEKRSCWPFTA